MLTLYSLKPMQTQSKLALRYSVLVILVLAGCDSPDRQPIKRLLTDISQNVVSKLRPELNQLHGQERSFTFFRDQSRDAYLIVDDFLASNPALSDAAREMVLTYRKAEFAACQHHESLLSNGNFNLSDEEFDEGVELKHFANFKMCELSQFLKEGDLD